ncbi:MAG: prepilin-type N-terminal cleavage/methylation domain-containing protein [Phycisphaerales bacterium]|nr:prepilin-type N-terminal cleavage/methylation domain-containing protein [Phycisphaerales bacterium]
MPPSNTKPTPGPTPTRGRPSFVPHSPHSVSPSLRLSVSSPAFTLIELLVVISIIALLIGILLPALGKARAEGWKVRCLTNLKGLGTSMAMYFNDSNGTFPFVEPIAGVDENDNSTDLFEVLDAYIDAPRPRREDPNDLVSHNWIVQDPYRCPADRGGTDPENPDPSYATYGISYDFPPASVYVALETFGAIDNPDVHPEERDKARKAVSRAYEEYSGRGNKLAVLIDLQGWHNSGSSSGKNALYWDGSADIYPGDPPEEVVQGVLELIFKLCNFGG